MKFTKHFQRTHFLCVLIAFSLISGAAVSYLNTSRADVSALIGLGDVLPMAPFWPDGLYLTKDSPGYDGYFYFNLALDPLDQNGVSDYLGGEPAYRHSRILYPLAAYLASFGIASWVPWTLVLINLLAVSFTVLVLYQAARQDSASGWWAILWVIAPGIWVSVFFDLAEPFWLLLIALGVASAASGKNRYAALWLSLAVLTRELTIVLVIGWAVFQYIQRRKDKAGSAPGMRLAFIPLIVFTLWQIAIRYHYGAFGFQQKPGSFVAPFFWLPVIWNAFLENPSLAAGITWLLQLLLVTVALAIGIQGIFRKRGVTAYLLLAYGLFSLFMSSYVWNDMISVSRTVGAPLFLLLMIHALDLPKERRVQKPLLVVLLVSVILNAGLVVEFYKMQWPRIDWLFLHAESAHADQSATASPRFPEDTILVQDVKGGKIFRIDRTEVTNCRYRQCVEDPNFRCVKPWRKSEYEKPDLSGYPVANVNWRQARAFCKWCGGDLPTEEQWELAAGSQNGSIYPWGDDWEPLHLNSCDASCWSYWKDHAINDGHDRAASVCSFPQGNTLLGLCDMAGNLWEWTLTPYRNQESSSPHFYILKGGSFSSKKITHQINSRGFLFPENRSPGVGFRCAYSP